MSQETDVVVEHTAQIEDETLHVVAKKGYKMAYN